jgi:hypothetical protein
MTLNEAMTAYAVSPTEANKMAIVDTVAPELRAQIKDMAACIAKQQASLVAAKRELDAALDQPVPSLRADELRAALCRAATDCGHFISTDEMTLCRVPGQGGNALSQLLDRLVAAVSAAAPAPIQSAELAEMAQVIAFLNGEGPLDGFHFGDSDTARPRARYWWRKPMMAAWRALASPAAAPKQASSDVNMASGWCIERGPALAPNYLHVNGGLLNWTPDHMKAMRFARRADAEQITDIVEDADRIAEHVWTSEGSQQ